MVAPFRLCPSDLPKFEVHCGEGNAESSFLMIFFFISGFCRFSEKTSGTTKLQHNTEALKPSKIDGDEVLSGLRLSKNDSSWGYEIRENMGTVMKLKRCLKEGGTSLKVRFDKWRSH